MKLISIITPVFNAEPYIEKTIVSVLKQTYTNWEMLIVDDCSTDSTKQIVERYCEKDKRIRLIKHDRNQGVAAARNTALSETKGEYIAFLDGDDMWFPEKLEKQLHFMQTNNYVLTYTAFQKFYTDSERTGKVIHVPLKMTYRSIFYNTAIACLTVMVDKEKAGEFRMPFLKHTEDQCTWQFILKKGYDAYGLNESLALYRVGNNSLSANKLMAAKEQWSVYREYYGFSFLRSGIYFVSYVFHALLRYWR